MKANKSSIKGVIRSVLFSVVAVVVAGSLCHASEDGDSLRRTGVIDYISITDRVVVVDDKSYRFVADTEYKYPSGYTQSVEHFTKGAVVSLVANKDKELLLLILDAGSTGSSEGSGGDGNDQITIGEDGVYRN